jgi:hypothetical protein
MLHRGLRLPDLISSSANSCCPKFCRSPITMNRTFKRWRWTALRMRPVIVRARAPRRRDQTTSVLRRSRPTRRATVISPKKLRSISMVLRLIGKKYYVESGGLSPVASPEDFGRQVVRNERPRGQTLAIRGHDEVEAIALYARSRDSLPPPPPLPPKDPRHPKTSPRYIPHETLVSNDAIPAHPGTSPTTPGRNSNARIPPRCFIRARRNHSYPLRVGVRGAPSSPEAIPRLLDQFRV